MNILKYIQNNDDDGLDMLLEYLIKNLCLEQHKISNLTRLDKYCIILTIIMICVGNTLQYTIQCIDTDKEYTVDVHVGNIISKINDLDVTNMKVDIDSDNHITMSTPHTLRGSLTNTLSCVHLNGTTYDVTHMSDEQLNMLFDNLPYNIFNQLQQTYNKIHEQCKNIVYFEYRSPYVKNSPTTQYNFNLYNDDFYKFIKLLLREDLLSYYKMYYALTTKFKFDMTYVQSITPTETKMYLSMVREDIKKKNDQINEQKNKTIPVPVPGNDIGS